MLKLIVISFVCLFNSLLFSSFDGVYQLSVLDIQGNKLATATGFAINFKGKHILSSYHLLDNHILEADKIVMNFRGNEIELRISSYDNLRDILVLDTDDESFLDQDALEFGSCNNKRDFDVVGFRKGRQFSINAENIGETKLKGFYMLDTFLPKGFSGSPVLDDDELSVCGMVILSDKEDVNSVYVSKYLLSKTFDSLHSLESVSEHRLNIGLEYIVKNNEDLQKLSKRNLRKQVIVNIIGDDIYTLKNERNLIVNFLSKDNKGLRVLNSRNIYINGVKGGQLIVKNSRAITVANSQFLEQSYGILLINSSNMLISNNKFISLNNGILIKNINEDKLASIYVQKNQYKKVSKKLKIIG